MTKNTDKPTITLPNRQYQPNKKELTEDVSVNVTGKTIREKMNNFAKAVTGPAQINYRGE